MKPFTCDLCHEGLDSRRQAFKHFDKVHGGAGTVSTSSSSENNVTFGGGYAQQQQTVGQVITGDIMEAGGSESSDLKMGQLPVDTGGHCFLCLIKLELEPMSPGSGFEKDDLMMESPPRSIYPQHYLSLVRYVEADICKVLHQNRKGPLSTQVRIEDVDHYQVRVSLCDQCTSANEEFLELYRQLRKIEMEVTSCLSTIYDRMTFAERVQEAGTEGGFNLKAELTLAKGVREEVMQKCSKKLRSTLQSQASYPADDHSEEAEGPQMNDNHEDEGPDEASDLEEDEEDLASTSGAMPEPEPDVKMDEDEESNPEDDDDDYDPIGNDNDEDTGSTTSEVSTPESLSSEYSLSPQPSSDDDEEDDYDTYSSSDNGKEKLQNKSTSKDDLSEDAVVRVQNRKATIKHLIIISPPEQQNLAKKPWSSLDTTSGEHQCLRCPRRFKNSQGLGLHYRNIHLQIRYKCAICSKIFIQRSNFHEHCVKAHDIGVKFPCDLCHKSFNLPSILKRHREKHHPKGGSPIGRPIKDLETGRFKCSVCPKYFTNEKKVYHHHRRAHLSKLSFKCDHLNCGKVYSERSKLRNHQKRAHQGIRFTCSVCQKSFLYKNSLDLHLRKTPCGPAMGLEPRPPPKDICHRCGKAFYSPSELRRHLNEVHLNLKTHLCDLCGQKFKSGSGLRHHRKVHEEPPKTPSKPEGEHRCTICGKGYSTPTTLKKHVKEMHLEVRTYTCQICWKELAQERSLKAHMKACHKEAK